MAVVWAALKRYFFSGVLVVVPLILTYIVLKFLFDVIDGLLSPLLESVFGYYVTGLGLVTTVLIIILAGILTRNYLGARLHALGDSVLLRVPVIRPVYSAAKQLLESLTGAKSRSFKEVALVVYPREGSLSLGFVSQRLTVERDGRQQELVVVFVPSTPTPVSGMVVLVPAEDVMVLDMTVEDGVKFLVSGGVVAPGVLKRRPGPPDSEREEDLR